MTDRPGARSSRPTVLRATSSLVAFWAVVGLVVLLMGDAALRGSSEFLLRWSAVVALVVWGFWVLLYHSSIRIEPDHVVVVNLLRVHRIPWRQVRAIVEKPQIRIELADGSRRDCWGAPFAARPGLRGRETGPSQAVQLLEAAKESAPESDAVAWSGWDVRAVTVGCILLALALLALIIVRP
ncbi:PH domain-containing protein [Microbacterium sp. TNHR37B]|uniref:PH domain-containing protein n=1 Tax=Microbacterium sp. TNHR37B TaxID=1775956 RepID=UPI0007B21C9B|nr:PH domain-containing protein [Microbacterium sp. TNHR37B]KZE91294.1 hypothetical protein AVP41_00833 [Microbacterium sp. TNHR37B]